MTMNAWVQSEDLRPELRETAEMIRASFPNGAPEEGYLPLLALLHECMSFRSIATVVSYCTEKPYITVYHDVMGAVSPEGPDASALAPVKKLLQRHGYDAWLASED